MKTSTDMGSWDLPNTPERMHRWVKVYRETYHDGEVWICRDFACNRAEHHAVPADTLVIFIPIVARTGDRQ